MQPQGLDLVSIINQGAIATYPLILLSIISVTVVFERLWSLRNLSSMTLRIADSLQEPLKKGQRDLAVAICKQNSNSPAGRIFLKYLESRKHLSSRPRQRHRHRGDVRRKPEAEKTFMDSRHGRQ